MIEAALLCLTLNGFHEARGETLLGQMAVAQVVLNRAGRDPAKVCEVVQARQQFSWTIKPPPVKDAVAYAQAREVATLALYTNDFTSGATHYHALGILPYWRSDMQVCGQWGAHIFYRVKGKK